MTVILALSMLLSLNVTFWESVIYNSCDRNPGKSKIQKMEGLLFMGRFEIIIIIAFLRIFLTLSGIETTKLPIYHHPLYEK
jgi:hypothetical protein